MVLDGLRWANGLMMAITWQQSTITRKKKEITDKKIYGIHIVNHHLKQPDFNKRNKKPFGSEMMKDAEAGEYGLLTTIELLNGFSMFISRKCDIDYLLNNLKKFGEINF